MPGRIRIYLFINPKRPHQGVTKLLRVGERKKLRVAKQLQKMVGKNI
jgi:hypothetical protein